MPFKHQDVYVKMECRYAKGLVLRFTNRIDGEQYDMTVINGNVYEHNGKKVIACFKRSFINAMDAKSGLTMMTERMMAFFDNCFLVNLDEIQEVAGIDYDYLEDIFDYNDSDMVNSMNYNEANDIDKVIDMLLAYKGERPLPYLYQRIADDIEQSEDDEPLMSVDEIDDLVNELIDGKDTSDFAKFVMSL